VTPARPPPAAAPRPRSSPAGSRSPPRSRATPRPATTCGPLLSGCEEIDALLASLVVQEAPSALSRALEAIGSTESARVAVRETPRPPRPRRPRRPRTLARPPPASPRRPRDWAPAGGERRRDEPVPPPAQRLAGPRRGGLRRVSRPRRDPRRRPALRRPERRERDGRRRRARDRRGAGCGRRQARHGPRGPEAEASHRADRLQGLPDARRRQGEDLRVGRHPPRPHLRSRVETEAPAAPPRSEPDPGSLRSFDRAGTDTPLSRAQRA
jgi:hypothetical protein